MFKTILVPVDGSPLSDLTTEAAVKFAKETGARLIGIAVAEPHPSALLSDSEFFGSTHGIAQRPHDLAKEFADRVAAAATAAGVPCETVSLHAPTPHKEWLRVAKETSCDLIFVAAREHRGLTGHALDAEIGKLVVHSTVPVLLYH